MASKTTPLILTAIILVSAVLIYSYYIVGVTATEDFFGGSNALPVNPVVLPVTAPVNTNVPYTSVCPLSEGPDLDNDGIFDQCDNCPDYYNPEQRDDDYDGIGNECELVFGLNDNGDDDDDEDIACNTNADCGTDGFIGSPFCSVSGNVAQSYQLNICENAGTEDAECRTDLETREIQQCTDVCFNGECREIMCSTDADCDDSNDNTEDTCLNPGTPASMCNNEPIECLDDTQCTDGGFTGDLFCIGDDIFQEFLSGMCVSPGQVSSMCDYTSSNVEVDQCDFACFDGACIECDEDLDCNDNDPLTTDTCLNPGTAQAMCDNPFTGSCVPGETRSCGQTDVGQCQFGTQTCGSDGEFGACVGAINPVPEMCNNLDDDCDGQTDEINQCNPDPLCDNGIDDDGDGLVDFPEDPGCENKDDDSEDPFNTQIEVDFDYSYDGFSNPYVVTFECSITDGNFPATLEIASGDGTVETFGPFSGPVTQTWEYDFDTEGTFSATCTAFDDDGDHASETITLTLDDLPACADGEDNDDDGWIDLSDSGCTDVYDNDESDEPQCTNECTLGDRMCADSDGYQLCADFNGDGCTEWSAVAQCGFGLTCEVNSGQCVPF